MTHVAVDIRVPHVRVSVDSTEVVVDGSCLHFSSAPYLLVLTFPAPLLDNDVEGCATYDPSKNGGTISLKLTKEEPGMWPDLDLMGSLLTPRKSTRTAGIEILDESSSLHASDNGNDSDTQDEVNSSLSDIRSALRPHYGFMNLHSRVFTDLAREGLAAEMLQLPDPDITGAGDRRALRLEKESNDFDANRYLGDLDVEDDYIYQTAMNMKPHWQHHDTVENLTEHLSELATADNDTDTQNSYFTPEESAQLASIPYPLLPRTISPQQDESLFLGLLDILFGYVYDHLMTDGDPTTESSWTVCILSSTLSWLDAYNSTDDSLELVVQHSIRRALIYPYLRNYEIAMYCWSQLCYILKKGRRCIIRCLLQVRAVLDKSECHYLGNRLYVDPYLLWIQRHVTDLQVTSLWKRLNTLLRQSEKFETLQKNCLKLGLVELE